MIKLLTAHLHWISYISSLFYMRLPLQKNNNGSDTSPQCISIMSLGRISIFEGRCSGLKEGEQDHHKRKKNKEYSPVFILLSLCSAAVDDTLVQTSFWAHVAEMKELKLQHLAWLFTFYLARRDLKQSKLKAHLLQTLIHQDNYQRRGERRRSEEIRSKLALYYCLNVIKSVVT